MGEYDWRKIKLEALDDSGVWIPIDPAPFVEFGELAAEGKRKIENNLLIFLSTDLGKQGSK